MATLLCDDSVGKVSLVGDEHFGNTDTRVCLDLLQPVLNVIKSSLFCAIIDKDDTHGALVVGLCDCTETFLASSVPHLELHALVLHIDGLDLEVNSYCKVKVSDMKDGKINDQVNCETCRPSSLRSAGL